MNKQTITIQDNQGIDATPIAHLVQIASSFDSNIYIEIDTKKINAKSIMGMMTLQLIKGQELTVIAEGTDQEQAVHKVIEFIKKRG